MPAKKNETRERLLLCINGTLQKKAKDVVVLNLKEISAFTDYMIICSGTSERQVQAMVLQTVASTSIVAAGGGWTASGGAAKILSVGGGPVSVSAIGNAGVELTGFKPRDVNITGTGNSTGGFTATTIIDSGLFVSTPTAAIAPGGTLPTTLASITFVMGTANDTVLCQPL